jgi:glutathione S-transferase
VRTPPAERDMVQVQKDADAAAEVWAIADRLLASRRFMEGDQFTLADIAIGAYARRWLGVEGITRPAQPNLTRWLAELGKRPGFAPHVAPPMS